MSLDAALTIGGAVGAAIWWIVLLLPWRPWSTRERLSDAAGHGGSGVAGDVTVLIPARNEAETLPRTLDAVLAQQGLSAGSPGPSVDGARLDVVVVDDRSTDATASVIARYADRGVRLVEGREPPPGWSGKLWALQQGLAVVDRPLTLLLDADIQLEPGALVALLDTRRRTGAALVSVMAHLRMASFWERWLMPAFIYFFKLLYPFRLANDPRFRWLAAAAGGCVLLETRLFAEAGLFESIRGALIDDCALARVVKRRGERTWVGLGRTVTSHRRYDDLGSIWEMVARTAYTQLARSVVWLLVCTLLMVAAFVAPIVAAVAGTGLSRGLGVAGWAAMALTYLPTLRYYRRSLLAAPLLPLVGALYLAMTWTSAWRHWRGRTARWRGRVYADPTPH